jgi:hypothetical protein
VRHQLSWGAAPPLSFTAAYQEFERGRMIWAGAAAKLSWILYSDGSHFTFLPPPAGQPSTR